MSRQDENEQQPHIDDEDNDLDHLTGAMAEPTEHNTEPSEQAVATARERGNRAKAPPNRSPIAQVLLFAFLAMLILMAAQVAITVGRSIAPLQASFSSRPQEPSILIEPAGNLAPSTTSVGNLALQPDGKLLIGGNFTTINGITRQNIARINPDGSLDQTFDPGSGTDNVVHAIMLQPDGKILIAGDFSLVNNVSRQGIARLNPDGSLDTSFDPGVGVAGSVWEAVLQPDGKVIVAGDFNVVAGKTRNYIARLQADGTLDSTFNATAGPDSWITGLDLQPDGSILIGGDFSGISGMPRFRVARLLGNGTLDQSFDPGSSANERVRELIVQPDGKVLVAGRFTGFNGAPYGRIVRLNTDGTLDTDFRPGSGANGPVLGLRMQPDGKLLISGDFTTFNGHPCSYFARLLPNGSLDTTWLGNADNTVWDLAVQPDGKIVIAGDFTMVKGAPRQSLARLNADGTLDTSFAPLP
jgi:uncharacterized delta-60 repeat protein